MIDDPFADVQSATDVHRGEHGCWAYPYADGSLLGVMAAASGAHRIVEFGTALGYTSLWLAHGAPRSKIDTIELDPEHARIARQNFVDYGVADRVTVHVADASAVLERLTPGYDLAFFDGYEPSPHDLEALGGLLRPGGILVSGNLTLGASVGDSSAARELLLDSDAWLTTISGDTAICVKLDGEHRIPA